MKSYEGIFWLHIKKSAGISTRKMLASLYVEDNRSDMPQCFIQAEKDYWNDILNNFRTPLGGYQFRRMLFAKKFLFSEEEFQNRYKFAFSRNPLDRCLSQFFYLWHTEKFIQNLRRSNPEHVVNSSETLNWNLSRFLEAIEKSRISESNTRPYGVHFQTHTATMFDDITDEDSNILLDKIWRIESLHPAINEVRQNFGLAKLESGFKENVTSKVDFQVEKAHKAKIFDLFKEDFDIYENADTSNFK